MGRKSRTKKKAQAWVSPKASPKASLKGSLKESPKESPKASLKESPRASLIASLKLEPDAGPKDSPKESPKDSPKLERNSWEWKPPIVSPRSDSDPRVLGKGASKMVWLERTDENMDRDQLPHHTRVVVNSFDEQLFRKGTNDEVLASKMAVQRNEYEFTRMIHDLFPDMIPQVYDIEDDMTPQPRFRYYKDRCASYPANEELFHSMIQMIDRLIEQGWAYLDMKPGNIGELEGRPVLMDTDPCFFYKIPPQATPKEDASIRRFYRVSGHIIVVLFCLNHAATIPTQVLKDFMDTNGYTIETLLRIYRTSPVPKQVIEDYNNEQVDRTRYNVVFTKLVEPIILLAHYGSYKQPIPKVDSKKRQMYSPYGTALTEIITLNPRQRLEQLLYRTESH